MKIDHQEQTNYFASMTDLLVGFLFVFVIMVAYFAYQVKDDQKTVTQLAEYLSAAQGERDTLVLAIVEDLQKLKIPAKIGSLSL